MKKPKKTIMEFMAEISAQAKELDAMCNSPELGLGLGGVLGFHVSMPSTSKEGPTVQELTLSEMVGMPVKIQ